MDSHFQWLQNTWHLCSNRVGPWYEKMPIDFNCLQFANNCWWSAIHIDCLCWFLRSQSFFIMAHACFIILQLLSFPFKQHTSSTQQLQICISCTYRLWLQVKNKMYVNYTFMFFWGKGDIQLIYMGETKFGKNMVDCLSQNGSIFYKTLLFFLFLMQLSKRRPLTILCMTQCLWIR